MKIQAIRTHQPCDGDVVDFLTNAFPHLYLETKKLTEDDVLWGETITGRDSAAKEVSINFRLIQLWLEAHAFRVNRLVSACNL